MFSGSFETILPLGDWAAPLARWQAPYTDTFAAGPPSVTLRSENYFVTFRGFEAKK